MILIWGNHRPIKLHCIVFLYCISFNKTEGHILFILFQISDIIITKK